jgi:MerR family mercuric resistance operon transcriptional regulator
MNGKMAGLLIGEVAQRTGVSATTIRYYEELGLLPSPPRSSAGYRRYSEQSVEELRFIRKAQSLGFSLDEIGGILKLSRSGETACAHVLSLAHQHLASVEERIRQLQHFRDHLAAEIAKWNGADTPTCRGLCQIIAGAEMDAVGSARPESDPVHPRLRRMA